MKSLQNSATCATCAIAPNTVNTVKTPIFSYFGVIGAMAQVAQVAQTRKMRFPEKTSPTSINSHLYNRQPLTEKDGSSQLLCSRFDTGYTPSLQERARGCHT